MTWDKACIDKALRRSGQTCDVEDDQSGQMKRSICRI